MCASICWLPWHSIQAVHCYSVSLAKIFESPARAEASVAKPVLLLRSDGCFVCFVCVVLCVADNVWHMTASFVEVYQVCPVVVVPFKDWASHTAGVLREREREIARSLRGN